MSTQLATKSDLLLTKTELRGGKDIRQDMQLFESRLTVRLGSIMVVGMAMLFAALKRV